MVGVATVVFVSLLMLVTIWKMVAVVAVVVLLVVVFAIDVADGVVTHAGKEQMMFWIHNFITKINIKYFKLILEKNDVLDS